MIRKVTIEIPQEYEAISVEKEYKLETPNYVLILKGGTWTEFDPLSPTRINIRKDENE